MRQFIVGLLLLACEGQVIAGCGAICRPAFHRPTFFPKRPVIVEKVVEEQVFIKFNPVLLAIQTVELPTYSTYVVPVVPQQVLVPTQPLASVPASTPIPSPQNVGLGRIEAMLAGMSTKLDSVASRQASVEARLKNLEEGASLLPEPVDPPKATAPPVKSSEGKALKAAENKALDGLGVWNLRCAGCHLKGKEKDHGEFILLIDAKTRASMTGKQLKAMTKHISQGTMPPEGHPRLTDQEASIGIADLSNFEVR